jgi:N-dimethylarginine dimethylaminohydrolase
MVAPAHFTIRYEINPWMDRKVEVDAPRAEAQWNALHRLLAEELGADVRLAEPQPALPDMVFTANAGLVYGERVILSNFRHPERQGEKRWFGEWFARNGFRVEELPDVEVFEGEGDALFAGETLFAGYYWRSDVAAHTEVGERLGLRVLSLQLVDPAFYHLDTCFCPLDADTLAYYPPAFDEYARRVIEANFSRRIELEPGEAARFAANAVVLGPDVVLNSGCPHFEAALRDHGFTPHATPLDEFLKAGGSAKCLTLLLDHPVRASFPNAVTPSTARSLG